MRLGGGVIPREFEAKAKEEEEEEESKSRGVSRSGGLEESGRARRETLRRRGGVSCDMLDMYAYEEGAQGRKTYLIIIFCSVIVLVLTVSFDFIHFLSLLTNHLHTQRLMLLLIWIG